MKRSLLAMLLVGQLGGTASAEPTPEWAKDAVDTLQQKGIMQGYPDGETSGQKATTRNEAAEIFERTDQQRLSEEEQYAPRSEADELRQEIQAVQQGSSDLETRVENLEQNTDNLEQREEQTARPRI